MLLAIKTQLKLNNDQRVLMAKHAGIARFTFNWGLATWNALYKDGFKPNEITLRTFFNNEVKTNPDLPWLKEKGISQKVTEFAFRQLGDSFKRFFRGEGAYPNFKKKGKSTNSFTINYGGKPMDVGGTRIKLPVIGWIRTYEGLPNTTTTRFTISERAGNWYISFPIEKEIPVVKCADDWFFPTVGVDLGISTLATLSDGKTFKNPKSFKRSAEKLARHQRRLVKKVKGSNQYKKEKLKLAKIHKRISDIRLDATHKATSYIAKKHGKIVIEDLNVKGMMANHKLAGSVADANFYEFRRQLEYKSKMYGSEVIVVNRFFPSTKKCSKCGHKQEMPLKERTFNCGGCGLSLNRDLNAALNLEHEAYPS